MLRSRKGVSVRNLIIFFIVLLNAIVLVGALAISASWLWAALVSVPLFLLAMRDATQTRHAIIRNYPLVGHLRYLFESIRPEMRQYFFGTESHFGEAAPGMRPISIQFRTTFRHSYTRCTSHNDTRILIVKRTSPHF